MSSPKPLPYLMALADNYATAKALACMQVSNTGNATLFAPPPERDVLKEALGQYVAAYNTMVGLGYTYHGGELMRPPLGKPPEYLMTDTDPCPGCTPGGVCRTPTCGRLKARGEKP